MVSVIGLAVGRGTGPELATVFEQAVDALARAHRAEVRIVRSPRTYHSYVSLKDLPRQGAAGIEAVRELTAADAEHYEGFCRELVAEGATAVFRTAINAQSLYLVRERLQTVKVDRIGAAPVELLLVRDQAQGFYSGENAHTPGQVTRTMTFTRELTERIVEFALARARELWPDGRIDQIVMAYKFHLLDGALGAWVAELSERLGVDIRLYQPDTVNRNLIELEPPPRSVVIAGNEWGDIMHVVLLDRFGGERQESRYTENIHLRPDVAGLTEYQTVHGSADDLEGRGLVNPVATLRAAAAVLERHAGCAGAIEALERSLAGARAEGVLTPDEGGRHSTGAVAAAVLAGAVGSVAATGAPIRGVAVTGVPTTGASTTGAPTTGASAAS